MLVDVVCTVALDCAVCKHALQLQAVHVCSHIMTCQDRKGAFVVTTAPESINCNQFY